MTSTATPGPAPISSWTAFVQRQLQDLMGRAPTSSELSTWVSRLQADPAQRGQLIADLRVSSRHVGVVDPVVRLYRAFFLRHPDRAGLDYWISRRVDGQSLNQVSQAFASSPEFRTMYGSLNNRAFVQRVYLNVLGRSGTTADVSYWTSELDSGRRNRGTVMIGFSESDEYKGRSKVEVDIAVISLFMLRRAPSAVEIAFWRYERTQGRLDNVRLAEWVLAHIVYSATGNRAATVIATGGNHTCALLADRTVRCWGSNREGQLGDGTTTHRSSPVTVTGLTGAIAISPGAAHTCALMANGTARCWGQNLSGQLGDGTTTGRRTPVSVSGLAGATAITAGGNHTCALINDGTARCWGDNWYGQLGKGDAHDTRVTPVTVLGLAGATALVAGLDHTCALIDDGTARCWGNNLWGQVGEGTNTNRWRPFAVVGLTEVVAISAGGAHTCALKTDGTARCWGFNWNGQLGSGSADAAGLLEPVTVAGLTQGVAITAGGGHTCALTADGTGRCWGYNASGQIGDGTTTDRRTPVIVSGLAGASAITASDAVHSCAVLTNGTARCWGDNGAGGLGDGTTTNRSTPVAVVGL